MLAPMIRSRQQERGHGFSPTEGWSSTETESPGISDFCTKRSSSSAAREVETQNGERQSSGWKKWKRQKPTCAVRNESCINSDVATCSAKGVSGCVLGGNVCSREIDRETGDEEALGRWRRTRHVWRRKYGCREHITKRWPHALEAYNILTDVAVMTPSSEMTLSSAWEAAGVCAEPYVYRSENRMVNFQQEVKINKKTV